MDPKVQRTFDEVMQVVRLVHQSTEVVDKLAFYDVWAETYNQDVAVLEFHSPRGAADFVVAHFPGNRGDARVLDVACGTGTVANHLAAEGFKHFVGIDGSSAMLGKAKNLGLYQELKQCILGQQRLPVQKDSFDVVVIAGALSVGHVPVGVIRELRDACKPGGYVCMTSRDGEDNQDYKACLEAEIQRMEEEQLWTKVGVTVVENWERSTSGKSYITGTMHFYQRT